MGTFKLKSALNVMEIWVVSNLKQAVGHLVYQREPGEKKA